MNEMVNEALLIILTVSAVLAGATALASEIRMRRDRIVSDGPENRGTR